MHPKFRVAQAQLTVMLKQDVGELSRHLEIILSDNLKALDPRGSSLNM